MEIKLNHISVERTARYYTLGNLSEKTKAVWIVCHGYAQTGEEFIQAFDSLVNDDTVIIAPEGLSRFYTKGFSGKVGASWMTKEDRENDIKDYVGYLDKLYESVQAIACNAKIYMLGFSQGGATVSRWANISKYLPDGLILYASIFPPDVPMEADTKWNKTKTILAIGNDDAFINKHQIDGEVNLLLQSGIEFEFIHFKGQHQIYSEVLSEIKQFLSA